MPVRRNIACILLFFASICTYGQSDIFLTQQWFSRINFNPAATGNSNNVDVFLLNRQQWAGFDNAPRTSILNAHSYFNSIRSGLGISIIYDQLGVSRKTADALFSYAYHFNLGEQALLSFGLSGGIFHSNWDPKSNTTDDPTDPELLTEKTSHLYPDFNAGFELNTSGLTLGAAATHLTGSAPDKTLTGKPAREYYGYVRYRIPVSRTFDIVPGIMYRNTDRSNFFDCNLTAFLMKKYWAGVSYRPDNAFAAMVGMEIGMFRIGYAYDRSIGQTASLAANTHELMLSVRIRKAQKNRQNVRFLE